LGGWGFAVSSYSRRPKEAFLVAEYFASAESQKLAFLKGGILPSRKALYSDPKVLKAASHMKDLGRVLAGARPRPTHPRWPRISDALQMHVSAALSRQETPADALKAAAVEIRAAAAR
jgi:multiple sugar transport system substrate-binding protein